MNFIFFILICVNSYKYLTLYNWKVVKNILSNDNTYVKNNIKEHIFNDYKIRTCKKVKKILEKKKYLVNDIYELMVFYSAGLTGLKESINTYDSNKKINFARYTDKYINKNLNILFLSTNISKNKKNIKKVKRTKCYNWWKPYWVYINNDLHPTYANILKLKYSHDFKEQKKNYELAIIYNTTLNNITEIITTSMKFIYEKIKNENLLGEYFLTNKIFF